MEKILLMKADWKQLFEKSDCFNTYNHFIVIDIFAKKQQNFESW